MLTGIIKGRLRGSPAITAKQPIKPNTCSFIATRRQTPPVPSCLSIRNMRTFSTQKPSLPSKL